MEQPSRNFIPGPSKIPLMSSPGKEKTAWKLPSGSDAYHASTDVSLFSTSLPVLSHGKFNFNGSEQSVQILDDDFPSLSKLKLEGGVKDPLEDIEPRMIGSNLPGDEDELLAGLMDDFDLSGLPTQLEDLDDDLFGSGGGFEIEPGSPENLVNGISRLSTSDSISISNFSHYGYANGVGTVSGEHPYGEHPSRTLFVRNINSNVEDSELKSLFEQYGDIRTLYTACKHRGFVMISYYDIRAARNAMRGLQNKPLRRRKLDIHFSIPKVAGQILAVQLSKIPCMVSQIPSLGGLSPVGSNHLSGLASILHSHGSSPVKIAPIGKDPARINHLNQVISTTSTTHGAAYQQHYSVPDPKLSTSPGPVSSLSDSRPSSVGTLSGPQFLWGSPTIHSEQNTSSAWSASLKAHPFPSRGRGIGFPYTSQHGSFLGSQYHHHVGSAPSGVAFAGSFAESGSPSSRIMSMSRNGPIYFGNGSVGGMGATSNDGIIDRGRSRRADGGSQMDNKKQYQLDLDKIINGEDVRTTLMIKNIPNKYTSKMLLAAIDETHKGTYDFLYLPIDFKNKCNVGYAFINMVAPSHIITFYEAFNGKKWEKFNSEKVASLAYARIQGKTALISHFQNSSLMNEDKRCRPIVFQSEGQDNGDLDSFPTGNLNIFIRQPDGSYAGDSLDSPKGGDPDEK
ncbi:UNVERIFIED_CONTAM: protein MEI2-like 2 [Sesamum angustifolium]|uniref:Protein MEI2-like 2 n=1 Tax=Sesamum angustifolium TaxID=2727405 RepID=A0AAW2PFR1_9LAMI